jgi:hypothetical protein
MTCAKCGTLVTARPLQRVNEKGVPGIWWCWPCLKKHEPELYRNEAEDMTPIMRILGIDPK